MLDGARGVLAAEDAEGAEDASGKGSVPDPAGTARVSPSSKLGTFLALWHEAYECRLLPSSLPSGPPPIDEAALMPNVSGAGPATAAGARVQPAPSYRELKQALCEPEYARARGLLLSRHDFGEWRVPKALLGLADPDADGPAGAAGGAPGGNLAASRPSSSGGASDASGSGRPSGGGLRRIVGTGTGMASGGAGGRPHSSRSPSDIHGAPGSLIGRSGSLNSVESFGSSTYTSSGRPSPAKYLGGGASSGDGSGSSSPTLGGQYYYRSSSRVSHVVAPRSGEGRRASTAEAAVVRPVGAYTTARSPPPLGSGAKAQSSKDHSPHLKYGNPSGKPTDFLKRYGSVQPDAL